MSDEEKLQGLVAEMRILEGYLNEINSRQSLIARVIIDGRAALEAIKSLPTDLNSELLVPIGGGVYIHSTAAPPEKLVVGVGADVAMEKSKDEALVFLDERVKEAEKAVAALESQKAELTNRLNGVRAALSEVIEKQRKGQA